MADIDAMRRQIAMMGVFSEWAWDGSRDVVVRPPRRPRSAFMVLLLSFRR